MKKMINMTANDKLKPRFRYIRRANMLVVFFFLHRASIKMFSFAQVLIPVALLSTTVLGLPLTEENVANDLSLNPPVGAFGSPLNDDNRIVGGKEAAVGQFPHQVIVKKVIIRHVCGGSIISDRFIVTAARCYTSPNPNWYTVIAGSHSKSPNDGVKYNVAQWIVHEKYHYSYNDTSFDLRNDIALIQTTRPIVFNKLIGPIALQRTFIGGGAQATISGWGEFIKFVSLTLYRRTGFINYFNFDITNHILLTGQSHIREIRRCANIDQRRLPHHLRRCDKTSRASARLGHHLRNKSRSRPRNL